MAHGIEENVVVPLQCLSQVEIKQKNYVKNKQSLGIERM